MGGHQFPEQEGSSLSRSLSGNSQFNILPLDSMASGKPASFRRRLLIALGLTAGAVLLGSCATLSQADCRQGDWRGIGYVDGTSGYPVSRVDEHADACKEYGIAPNRTAYIQGRAEGLRQYCTPEGGWRAGRNGSEYAGVCQGSSQDAFLYAYNLGTEIASSERDVREAEEAADARRDARRNGTPVFGHFSAIDIWSARRRADRIYSENVQSFVNRFGHYPD